MDDISTPPGCLRAAANLAATGAAHAMPPHWREPYSARCVCPQSTHRLFSRRQKPSSSAFAASGRLCVAAIHAITGAGSRLEGSYSGVSPCLARPVKSLSTRRAFFGLIARAIALITGKELPGCRWRTPRFTASAVAGRGRRSHPRTSQQALLRHRRAVRLNGLASRNC
jgi:hypothetical protein